MKKHFILAAMTVAAIFTGCNNEEESLMPNANAPVSFVIDGPVTRTTTSAAGVTSFAEGDKIAMYSTGLKTEMEGTVFTVGNGGTLAAEGGGQFTFDGVNGAAFYAYYPTSAEGTTTNATFTVATDQSASEAFNQSDFMTSYKAVNTAQAETISLQFAHRLTLVKVELTGINNVTGVEMNNVQSTATWTYSGDNVTTSGTATTIKMGTFNNEYWAVVPAQTITTGTALFTIQADGKTYTYKPTASNITFAEGKAKKFRLTIAADGQTVVSLNTEMETAWGEETIEDGNVTEEIKNYITLPTTGNINIITDRKNIAGETSAWGMLHEYATATYNGSSFNITTTQDGQSWYKRTLYYFGYETLETGEYTLSYKAKVKNEDETGNNAKLQISILSAPQTGNPYFYGIGSEQNIIKYETLKATEAEYPCNIYINKKTTETTTSPSGNPTMEDNTEALTKFYLAIACYGVNEYTISDIKLIKK